MSTEALRDDSSVERAVEILAESEVEGVEKEYERISQHYGPEAKTWRTMYQVLIERDGRQYDRLHIELKDGTEKDVYFDITDFYGK